MRALLKALIVWPLIILYVGILLCVGIVLGYVEDKDLWI